MSRNYKTPTAEQLLAIKNAGFFEKVRSPRLPALAAFINASGKFTAKVEKWAFTKERKPAGSRIVTYRGNPCECHRLVVRDLDGNRRLEHVTGEAYRTNREVVEWIVENIIQPA